MDIEPSQEWKRLSKALFGVSQTTDEDSFVHQVMRAVRRSAEAVPDREWRPFLRWAIPALGLAVASFVLAVRSPQPASSASLDTLLIEEQASPTDALQSMLWEE